ncbi:NAD(P)-dependent oxidoreductase [Actinopolymorpha singaporensis]|uniref:3-hydroxyisobutyrate dehydrogenase n=1 Tax=Actinopolymorpha singaporensis TaxID=117157 RepID=A0A1H1LVF9_9ACTN|nr:NAD(P)-dependent oxidoreductase [Actinopolymorpha singaporensis]SDR77739.1 3-hydroxyisobutyrate dehydrogenase [Actinopolymorpha singaporensis]
MSDTNLPRVAFLGLGRMGAPMARHVLAAGYDLAVWNRTRDKAEPLGRDGAQVADTPARAAAGRQVVVLMLATPDAVGEVLFDPDHGVVATAEPGTLVIDSSTIGPTASREIAAQLGGHDLHYVDAPVYGSVAPATEGTLRVFAGGDPADFERARPLLGLWGDPDKVDLVGPVGTGSAAKLVVNLTLGTSIAAIGEALRLGRVLDLEQSLVDSLIEASPLGAAFPPIRAIMDSGKPQPANFELGLLRKDLDLCLAEAGDLALTAAAREACQRAMAAGHGSDDARALAVLMAGLL